MSGPYTSDLDTSIVHNYDDKNFTLAVCHQGFSANSMTRHIDDTVPTCVFCVVNMRAGLPQWRFLPKSNTYRRVIEENRDT